MKYDGMKILISKTLNYIHKKVKVGNDQEISQSERNSYTKNRGKNKLTIMYIELILRKLIVSRVSSYFPIGGHSVTQS